MSSEVLGNGKGFLFNQRQKMISQNQQVYLSVSNYLWKLQTTKPFIEANNSFYRRPSLQISKHNFLNDTDDTHFLTANKCCLKFLSVFASGTVVGHNKYIFDSVGVSSGKESLNEFDCNMAKAIHPPQRNPDVQNNYKK